MDWQDEGIFVHAAPFGESQQIITCLTEHHGRHRGLARAKSNIFLGAKVALQWRGRLEEHLGRFSWDQPHGHVFMLQNHPAALCVLRMMCLLVHHLLPERSGSVELYQVFCTASEALAQPHGLANYDSFERFLLAELGYHTPQESMSLLERLREREGQFLLHWPYLDSLHKERKRLMSMLDRRT